MNLIVIKGWIRVLLGDIKYKTVVMKTFYITTHDGNITDYNILQHNKKCKIYNKNINLIY